MLGNGFIKIIVLRVRTFSEGKLETYDQAMAALVHCCLFRGVVFGEARLLVLSSKE
jgi:hypothetical protein